MTIKSILVGINRVTPAVFLSFLLVSCSGVSVKDYNGQKPEFDIENFFSGKLEAHGFFQDRSGEIIKRFQVEMSATKDGDTVIVDERFTYSDGQKESRTWKLKKISANRYEGTAGDVIGKATVETAGFAFRMNYVLRLKIDGREIDVNMDDWMFRMSDRLILNKTKMSKWGFHLGDVTLTIEKK